ncbi:MAG TPA: ribbon-helix-helix protein, CopG family [Geomonas sp.]
MEYPQKQNRGASRKNGSKKDEKAMNHVVSLRVSDQEKRVLERITESTRKNVSDVVREAIEFWLSNRKRFCLEP